MSAHSFYWYDYETFGIDPRVDRIAQFAGVRTDMDFNVIGDPVDIYCKAADDVIPNPEACLITGITPQRTVQEGLIEPEFISRILQQFSMPDTCVVGFNNIRFDDEFTRYSLYRNFHDPYAREWQNGCSRWDIIDLVRMTRALRPEGIEWPVNDEGIASNRLELLTKANGIAHEAAHNALSDVYATIALAKLIKQKQEKLFDFVFTHKSKQKLSQLLNLFQPKVVLHTSGMYPGTVCNTAMIYPLAPHPSNKNSIIVYDLRYSPEDLINLTADEIIERLYTPKEELPEGVERIPLKTIQINKCPVVAPVSTLDEASARRLDIDRNQHLQHLEILTSSPGLQQKIKQKLSKVFSHKPFQEEDDPDKNLYGGGFFSGQDKQYMEQLRQLSAAELAVAEFDFKDKRLSDMLFRYRARNYPQSLSDNERDRWNDYRQHKFEGNESANVLSLDAFKQILEAHLQNDQLSDEKKQVLYDLQKWGEYIESGLIS